MQSRSYALCLLVVFAHPALAEDWYEVELIVFRHDSPGAGSTETWPADPGRPAVEAAVDLAAPAPGPQLPLQRLEPAPNRLAGTWDALKRSSRYEPLGYWAWIQPGFERGTEPAVRVALGNAPATAAADAAGFPVLGQATDAPPLVAPLRAPLDGSLALGLQRFLYAKLDLVYRPDGVAPRLVQRPRSTATDGAVESVAVAAPEFMGFRLTETRRLRSREVHYFDHPLFGALLLVTPRPMADIAPRTD